VCDVIPQRVGLVDITATEYHADQIDPDRPSLSKSIIQTLISQSPAHARVQHPRLNPDFQRVEEDKFSLGTAAHQMFLEGIDSVAVCPFDNWKTKAAQEAKAEARAYGKIPMLAVQYDECLAMVDAIRRQSDEHPTEPALFADGKAEQTLVWEEDGVLCRARLDWLRDDLVATDDLKTCRASANPEQWTRTAFGIGADIQQAFYTRGIRAVTGRDPIFRFVVAETVPPYAISVVSMGSDVLAIANKKIDYALDKWRRCLDSGKWPSYDQRIAWLELPTWEENRWLSRELRESVA
jgi:hypothetical protein